MYRNSDLTYQASADISRGYALFLASDGTVAHVAGTGPVQGRIIGWATGNYTEDAIVPVRTMYDGTIEVAITIDTAISRGTALYNNGDGTLTDAATSGVILGYALEDAVAGQLYVEAIILRQMDLYEEHDA